MKALQRRLIIVAQTNISQKSTEGGLYTLGQILTLFLPFEKSSSVWMSMNEYCNKSVKDLGLECTTTVKVKYSSVLIYEKNSTFWILQHWIRPRKYFKIRYKKAKAMLWNQFWRNRLKSLYIFKFIPTYLPYCSTLLLWEVPHHYWSLPKCSLVTGHQHCLLQSTPYSIPWI